jgi:hypothetical protein
MVIELVPGDATKTTKIGASLPPDLLMELVRFLRDNMDVFAWSPNDLVGIDPAIVEHRLNVIWRRREILDPLD